MSASQSVHPVSDMIADASPFSFGEAGACRVSRMQLQDGVELMSWKGCFSDTVDIPLRDDTDRVHFSFTGRLQGSAACHFRSDGGGHREYQVVEGSGSISYGRGRIGRYLQRGELENISLMVRPDIVQGWLEVADDPLLQLLQRNDYFLDGHRGNELRATAQALSQALNKPLAVPVRHRLWIQGQCMALVGLFLEARRPFAVPSRSRDQARLVRARDMLLADLSQAPSLESIARHCGLSASALERGFRQAFGTSAYGLFQSERMHLARQRLLQDEVPITQIAMDLGYSNTSHFAVAFRKQFGVNPSALKRSAR